MDERASSKQFRRKDYSKEIIKRRQSHSIPLALTLEMTDADRSQIRKNKRLILILIGAILLILIGGFGTWFYVYKNSSLVPKSISQSVTFPVYYPNPKKLPKGYTLNLNSFKTPIKNGVTYTVSYGNGKKIVFSIQLKPSGSTIQTFVGNYMPLRTAYQTAVGEAEIGAYNLKTLVSLPTNSNSWIIITAPPNINQRQLEQVLSAIIEG